MVEQGHYLGIDSSSKSIHYAWLDGSGKLVSFERFISKKRGLDERFFELMDSFSRFVDVLPPNIVVAVEAPIYIQNPNTTIALAQVVAGVKLLLRLKGVYTFVVGNTLWKKVILGNGLADKSQIKQFAMTRWNLGDELDQDVYDAVCIALWILRRFREEELGN